MLPGTMGLLQSTEVLKLILGTGSEMVGQLLLYDALEVDFRKIHVPLETTCQLCGLNPVSDLNLELSNDLSITLS